MCLILIFNVNLQYKITHPFHLGEMRICFPVFCLEVSLRVFFFPTGVSSLQFIQSFHMFSVWLIPSRFSPVDPLLEVEHVNVNPIC